MFWVAFSGGCVAAILIVGLAAVLEYCLDHRY